VRVLRQEAGDGRPSRWWDRGLWFCGIAAALIFVGLGGWALSDKYLGQPVKSTVNSCETELHLAGRWLRRVTSCDVTVVGTAGVPAHMQVDTTRPYSSGSSLRLLRLGNSYADTALTSNYIWGLPLGLAVGVGAWWMGLPSRVDLEYGRHAAPRSRQKA
jgi:hypothetical protein